MFGTADRVGGLPGRSLFVRVVFLSLQSCDPSPHVWGKGSDR